MNIIKWIVVFTGLTITAGCASTPPRVTGTEGAGSASDVAGLSEDSVDTDGDSIVDADDSCPDTDEQALVDDTGCEVRMGAVEGLNFGPDEVTLSGGAEQVIDRYIEVLNRYPDITVTVEGHTDNRGAAESNLELSKERVVSVVRYMVGNGINPDRIKPYGYGESRPRAANATAEGREQNRRIEINVINGLL